MTADPAATPAAEEILDGEMMSRLIDFPSMYEASRTELALQLVCTFPGGQEESLVWRKYAPHDDDVHHLGCGREAKKRLSKPEARYKGFSTTTAGVIRHWRNVNGHGFLVHHAPEEGIHHAVVTFAPATGRTMQKTDRTELKLWLGKVLSALVPHACPEPQG